MYIPSNIFVKLCIFINHIIPFLLSLHFAFVPSFYCSNELSHTDDTIHPLKREKNPSISSSSLALTNYLDARIAYNIHNCCNILIQVNFSYLLQISGVLWAICRLISGQFVPSETSECLFLIFHTYRKTNHWEIKFLKS